MTASFDKTHRLNAPRHPVMATLITTDLDASLLAYSGALGYVHLEKSALSADLADHYVAPALAGARTALLAPKSGVPVFIRLVEAVDAARPSPSCGWLALEICVQDVEALHDKLNAGDSFTPFAPPKPLSFTDRVYPMQCKGPSGEIIYLNQVRGSLPDIHLPIASSPVDHIFIVILNAPDMERSNEFYAQPLDMRVNERHEIAYKTLNRIHGLPLDTPHQLSTLGAPRSVSLEINQWPVASGSPKLQDPDVISEGIFMVSYAVEALPEEYTASPLGSAPYNGARSIMVIGPSGERIELIALD